MASLYRTVSRSVALISRGAGTSTRALSSSDRQARDESAVPPEIQQKATMECVRPLSSNVDADVDRSAERKLPKSLGDAQGDDTGRSHATDTDKSKVPEASAFDRSR